MLQYLYGLDYTIDVSERVSEDPYAHTYGPNYASSIELLVYADVYSIGDKYGINGLKGVASEKFATTLRQNIWHAWDWTDEIGILCTVIKHIFTSTPDSDKGLRSQVLKYAKINLKHLLQLENFKKLLTDIPELCYQLLLQKADCPNCDGGWS